MLFQLLLSKRVTTLALCLSLGSTYTSLAESPKINSTRANKGGVFSNTLPKNTMWLAAVFTKPASASTENKRSKNFSRMFGDNSPVNSMDPDSISWMRKSALRNGSKEADLMPSIYDIPEIARKLTRKTQYNGGEETGLKYEIATYRLKVELGLFLDVAGARIRW